MKIFALTIAAFFLSFSQCLAADDFPLLDDSFSCLKNYTSSGSVSTMIKNMERHIKDRGNRVTTSWKQIDEDKYRLDFNIDDRMSEKRADIRLGFVKHSDSKALLYYISTNNVPGNRNGTPGYREYNEEGFDKFCSKIQKLGQ